MIIKSFSQFITESTSANLVPINESRFGNKFKIRVNTPQPGETYNLSFSAVINPGEPQPNHKDTKLQIEDMAKGYAEANLINSVEFQTNSQIQDYNGEPARVLFINNPKIRQRVVNNRVLFDADLSFKNSSSFKPDKEIQKMIDDGDITPYMIINPSNVNYKNINIWDISKMAILTKGSSSDETKPEVVKKEETKTKTAEEIEKEKKDLADTEAAKKNNTLDSTKKAEAVVGAAAFPAVSGAKQIKKGEAASEEIRKLQKMIMAGAIANATDPKYKKAADLVRTHGGADGKYGGQTALAIGTLLDNPDVKYTAITSDVENSLKAALSAVTDANITTIEAGAAKKTNTATQTTNTATQKTNTATQKTSAKKALPSEFDK